MSRESELIQMGIRQAENGAGRKWKLSTVSFTKEETDTIVHPSDAEQRQHSAPRVESDLTNLVIDKYELLELIGRGGMSVVFKARHKKFPERRYALKLLRQDMTVPDMIDRFEQEILALGNLQHPNVVYALDAGEWQGTPYLVMEHVDGADLEELAEHLGPLRMSDACELVRQAAFGLQHAFEKGLTHRDLKPSNLMLARGELLVKMLDLGLARLRGCSLTVHGEILGTPDYMAPEQWEDGHNVDVRADIYSLGCTLYRLLAGRPPFGGDDCTTALSKMRAHASERPVDVTDIRRDIPTGLADALERMLAKRPSDRFQTPQEVADAMEVFCEGANLRRLAAKMGKTNVDETIALNSVLRDFANLRPDMLPTDGADRGSSHRVLRRTLIGMTAGLALSAAAWGVFTYSRSSDVSTSPIPHRTLKVLSLQVDHFQPTADLDSVVPLGQIGQDTGYAQFGDHVRVSAELSDPAYVCIFAFNPDGSVQQFGDDWGKRQQIEFPEEANLFFRLSDGRGQQAFCLVASRKRIPTLDNSQLAASDIPWQQVETKGVWQFDGERVKPMMPDRVTRGEIVAIGPSPFETLCRFLKRELEVETMAAIAFGVE